MDWRTILEEPVLIESLALVAALIAASHFIVRRYVWFLPTEEQEYLICGRYVTGTLSIGVPFSFICWAFGWWEPLALFWACAVLAGIATFVCYWADRTHELKGEAQAGERDLQKVGFKTKK